MADVFLDTSYAVALASPSDRHHLAALRLSEHIQSARLRLVTTRAIVLEIGNALSRRRYRATGTQLVSYLASDSMVQIVELTQDLFTAGFELFRSRADKEWGLTDCTSFIVMQERGITDALTADAHFRQAGFRPLLTSG